MNDKLEATVFTYDVKVNDNSRRTLTVKQVGKNSDWRADGIIWIDKAEIRLSEIGFSKNEAVHKICLKLGEMIEIFTNMKKDLQK